MTPAKLPAIVAAAALCLVGALAADAPGQDAPPHREPEVAPERGLGRGLGPRRGPRARGPRAAGPRGLRDRVRRQRQDGEARIGPIEALGFTTAQLELFLDRARQAEPIVREARKDALRVLMAARDSARTGDVRAAREEVRTRLREIRDAAAAKLRPLAADALAALTPEQRAMLEGFALGRGRELDDERLLRAATRVLARPGTVLALEVRLGR